MYNVLNGTVEIDLTSRKMKHCQHTGMRRLRRVVSKGLTSKSRICIQLFFTLTVGTTAPELGIIVLNHKTCMAHGSWVLVAKSAHVGEQPGHSVPFCYSSMLLLVSICVTATASITVAYTIAPGCSRGCLATLHPVIGTKLNVV